MNVLVADKFESEGISALAALGCRIHHDPSLANDALASALVETAAEVLVVRSTRVTAETLEPTRALKLIIRAGAGYDTIDTDAARKREIKVANCPGMNSVAVAELTLGLMLALDRRIPDNVVELRSGIWNKTKYSKARGLKGRVLGIVGMGRIGYDVAKRAKAFDMDVIYHDVVPQERAEKELGVRRQPFPDVLAEADFVCLHVPGGSETKNLIGEAELKMMKPTAFLINCSRGGVIDEEALARAIEAGKVAGAGLDVYATEPPAAADVPFTSPIAKVQTVYGTHHIGASTEQAQLAVAGEVARIVEEFKRSGNVINCVNG